MNMAEIQAVLDSMTVLVDRREQDTLRARKRYKAFGVPYERATLDYGDYSYNAVLPNGQMIYDTSERICPACSVERKMGADELAQCFTHDRKRFVAEFQRAQENGAHVVLLVENTSWEDIYSGNYRSRMTEKAFVASLTAFLVRYDLQLIFCKSDTSGQLIKELLYRDLKERLQRGEFDGAEDKQG